MSDLSTLRSLVIPHYDFAGKYLQFVEGVLGIMQRQFIVPLDILDEAIDLDNVEGILLDYIGLRLGFPRPLVDAEGEFFGFDTGMNLPDNYYGWNQRPFATRIDLLQTKTPIADGIYRRLLRARGIYIGASANYADVSRILDILYGEGMWDIIEHATDPSFTITYDSTVDSVIVNIVESNKPFLIPRVAGVACAVEPSFSFQTLMNRVNLVGATVDVTLPEVRGGTPPITYSISGLPSGLSFNALTRQISGTVGGGDMSYTVEYTATDDNSMTTSTRFTWVIELMDTMPSLAAIPQLTGDFGTTFDQILPEATGGNMPITYSTSTLLAGWTFNPATRRFTGTFQSVGNITVVYTATDADGDMDSQNLVIHTDAIVPGAPEGILATAQSDTEIRIAWQAPSSNGGRPITGYRIDVSEDNMAFTTLVATQTALEYNHTGLSSGDRRYYRVYAINSVGTSTDYAEDDDRTFRLPVADAGPDQANIAAGTVVTLDSSGSSDPDGTITSRLWTQTAGDTVTLDDTGAVMPTFTTPSEATAQTLTFQVLITDNHGLTDTDTVDIGVLAQAVDMMPSLDPHGDLTSTFGVATNVQFPEAMGGDPPLTYSMTQIPPGLSFNPTTRRVTGTPTTPADLMTVYTVTDADSDTDSVTFNWIVNAVLPGAPLNLSVSPHGPSQINLGWDAPASSGGLPITGYRIDVSEDNSAFTTLVASQTGTTYEHTGLSVGDQRYYRVYAITNQGTSTDFASGDATTLSVFDTLSALTGVDSNGAAAGSYAVDATTDTSATDYYEFSPAEGTIHDQFPSDMFSNADIIWLERLRVNNTPRITINNEGSNVLWQDFDDTWTDDWAFYLVDTSTMEYVIWQANDSDSVGGGFINFQPSTWTLLAYNIPTNQTPSQWLLDLDSTRIVLALCPVHTYLPTGSRPIADAGPDQADIAAGVTVTLDSSASFDPDGTIVSRVWTQTAGDTVTLDDNTAVMPQFTTPSEAIAQTLTFQVETTDNDGLTGTDTVSIGVLAMT